MPFLGVPQPTFGVARRRFRSRPIASQPRDTSVPSDASIEMPGNESSTSGGGTGLAADDLSDFVIERDARIFEVKKRKMDYRHRIEVEEKELAERRRQMDIRNRVEDEEDEFAEARRQLERRRRDEEDEFAESQRRMDRQRWDERRQLERQD